jgi:hypothetical protein
MVIISSVKSAISTSDGAVLARCANARVHEQHFALPFSGCAAPLSGVINGPPDGKV